MRDPQEATGKMYAAIELCEVRTYNLKALKKTDSTNNKLNISALFFCDMN